MTDRPPGRRAAPPAEGPALSLRIQAKAWREALPDAKALAARAVDAGCAVSDVKPLAGAELSLLFTDDKRIRAVNRDWRGLDKPTNVLSFPAAPPARIAQSPALGDVVLALETIQREAQEEDKRLEDHVSHLVIHGLLHLLGEDHETPAEAERMEALEIAALARLGIGDPYADSEPLTFSPSPRPPADPRTDKS